MRPRQCRHLDGSTKAALQGQSSRQRAHGAGTLRRSHGRDGPVTACARYIRNRWSQLDYQGALARGLPIGSGEIESAHRYIIQKRLKLPGAWWTPHHIEAMLALRIKRANEEWDSLWKDSEKQAA